MDEPREPTIDEPRIVELTTETLESVTGGDLLNYMITYAIRWCDCVFASYLRK